MNSERRERLRESINNLRRAESIIDTVLEQEKEALDNIPENLQYSDRSVSMESAINYLEDAISNVQEAIDNTENAVNERG